LGGHWEVIGRSLGGHCLSTKSPLSPLGGALRIKARRTPQGARSNSQRLTGRETAEPKQKLVANQAGGCCGNMGQAFMCAITWSTACMDGGLTSFLTTSLQISSRDALATCMPQIIPRAKTSKRAKDTLASSLYFRLGMATSYTTFPFEHLHES
jgi:hypothetical protein